MSDWYYSHNGEQKGPVPTEELSRLISGGGIDSEKDLVWREGMSDWKPANSVPELQLNPPVAPSSGVVQPVETSPQQPLNPYATPSAGYDPTQSIGPLPSVKPVNYPLMAGLMIIGLVGIMVGYGLMIFEMEKSGGGGEPSTTSIVVILGSLIPLLIGGIMSLICLYRAWVLLQPNTAFSTPGRAVGFLFIPLYSFYWYFVAFWRWSQEWNRLVASDPKHPHAPRANDGLFLTYAILNVAGIVPVVGSIAGLAGMVVFLIILKTLANAVNYAADA